MEAEIGGRVRARLNEVAEGLTQRDLAERIGMTPDAFSRALNGKRSFTAVELVQLAEILHTSAHWFVTGEQDPFAVTYAGRHTFDPNLKAHDSIDWGQEKKPLDNVALAYVQAYGDAPAERGSVRRLAPGDVAQRLEAAQGASWVRHLADALEGGFTIDLVRIREVVGAFALEVLGRHVIVVGETPNWFYENWSIAHELSHILSGDLSELGSDACDDPVSEKRANSFAKELLLPTARMRGIDWVGISRAELADFVWTSGVSTHAVRVRLNGLRITPSPEIEEALQLSTQVLLTRYWSAGEGRDALAIRMRDASARRFPAHLVAAHRSGIEEGTLSSATLAWMLGVDPSSLDELSPQGADADVDWLARELGLADSES